MPAPVNPVLDNFNRANETPLSNGGKWGADPLGVAAQINLVSNAAKGSVTTTSGRRWVNDTWAPDQEIFATVTAKPGAGNSFRLYARITSPGSSANGYLVLINDISGAGNDTLEIRRIDAGTISAALGSATVEFAIGDKFNFTLDGSTIKLTRWDGASWSELVTVTDSTYLPSSSVTGIGIRGLTGTLDDFGSGALFIDTATVVAFITPSVDESISQIYEDAVTIVESATPSGVEIANIVETATVLEVTSLVVEEIPPSQIVEVTTPSVDEQYLHSPTTDSALFTVKTTPSALDVGPYVDTSIIIVRINASQSTDTNVSPWFDVVEIPISTVVSASDHICTVTPQLQGVMQERWSGDEELKWLGILQGERWSGILVEGQLNNPC